ncbi:MAG: hypothetical protein N2255_04260 [Kiritimatiellae bacterium]|nr:hypothetical protein [Kiritimatiellia bacterium]
MALRVHTRIPYGNAAQIEIDSSGEVPTVSFTPSPHGGPECLWFCFRLVETEPDKAPEGKVKVVLKHFDNLLGARDAGACMPVCHPANQGWVRMKHGQEEIAPDGQRSVFWLLEHPKPTTDVALCFPYGRPELELLVTKSKGYWQMTTIGLSQGGRPLLRISNSFGRPGGDQPGLYLIARQHSGETPGSWVLDGMLQHFSVVRKNPFVIWAIPLSNIDGIERGDYGKDNFPYDLNRAWGRPAMRHEALVIQRDIRRWKERCRPLLALDFHAPGLGETDGIYCYLPNPDQSAEMHAQAQKWANVMKDSLTDEFASPDFVRVVNYKSRWETPNFTSFFVLDLGVCALSIETPYAMAGKTVLTQKQYREAGRRLAEAILRRYGR